MAGLILPPNDRIIFRIAARRLWGALDGRSEHISRAGAGLQIPPVYIYLNCMKAGGVEVIWPVCEQVLIPQLLANSREGLFQFALVVGWKIRASRTGGIDS